MPGWRPNCLRGSIYKDVPPPDLGDGENPYPGQDICETKKGSLVVQLQKKEGCGLGLTFAGGVDKGQRPYVSNLRPGSIAHRCDALLVGDLIVSVNGIRVAGLSHDEIIKVLKNTGPDVSLEVEYEMPDPGLQGGPVQTKCQDVVLDRELNSFGLTLRGGMLVERMRPHPLTVVAIRPGGPAHRQGSIQIGDQVLAINGYKVNHLSVSETLGMLSQCQHTATLTVSYTVATMDILSQSEPPVLIEVDRPSGVDLGLSLCPGVYEGKQGMCVEYIEPMGIADRCGAMQTGDLILSIDGAAVDVMSVAEAGQLLKSGGENHVRLELVPVTHLENCANRQSLYHNSSSLAPSFSSHTLPSLGPAGGKLTGGMSSLWDTSSVGATPFGTLNMRKRNTFSRGPDRRAISCMSIASSSTSVLSATNQVCRTEATEVMLSPEHRSVGLTLKAGGLGEPPLVTYIEPRSAADRCGLVQEGDRVLSVNGVETVDRSLEEVNLSLRDMRPSCVLRIEFDVTESVTPSSGTYVVKLAKRSGVAGIKVRGCTGERSPVGETAGEEREALVVTEVVRGSVAHRCGSIQPGDRLLAINDVRVDTYTADDATHVLEMPDDMVKLKLHREDADEDNEGCVVYTVELHRHGGPLGITISGTDDPQDPIVISELTPHGLAERTGAIHVGDRLLAVCGVPTRHRALSDAIRLLQSAGDVVTLKIARLDHSLRNGETLPPAYSSLSALKPSTPIASVDSAMESWPGSGQHLEEDTGHVMVLAVPQNAEGKRKWANGGYDHRADNLPQSQNLKEWETNSVQSVLSSVPGQQTEEEEEEESGSGLEDSDGGSSHMEEWVKTLEKLDMGSGSEMLKQIGLSLRQRSVLSLERSVPTADRPSLLDLPSSTVQGSRSSKPAVSPKRSRSACRVNETPDPTRRENSSAGRNHRLSLVGNNNSNNNNNNSISNKSRGRGGVAAASPHPTNPPTSSPYSHRTQTNPTSPSSKSMEAIHHKTASLPSRAAPPQLPTAPTNRSVPSRAAPPEPTNNTPTPVTHRSKRRSRGSGGKRDEQQTRTVFTPRPLQLQRVVLDKCERYPGFGLSLSDGLYDQGVYISAVAPGGLAHKAGLRMYDRVLQVNKTKTTEAGCGTVVPMIQDSGSRLTLVVCRNPLLRLTHNMREEMVGGGGEE